VRLYPQYEGLEALQKRYAGRGFAVLGFPSNDFKGQEPGDEKQIQDFCTLTYGVKFPMFEKVHVVGAEATPLYQRLTAATGVAPGWNFHKYLVGRDGKVIAQFASKVTPDDPQLTAAIDKALAAPGIDIRHGCLDIDGMRATMLLFAPTSAPRHFQECSE
jgi:glutathione peroxidase